MFGEHPTGDVQGRAHRHATATWTYCVQYRETDLNFVSRLLEQEGIYFYFTHDDGKHTLVMADSYSGHEPFQGKPVPFIDPDAARRGRTSSTSARWSLTREIQPGVYVHDDYDFERPSVELRTQKAVSRSYTPSDYEVFDYPGEYLQKADGERTAAVRIDEFAAAVRDRRRRRPTRGRSASGGLFTLDKRPRDDQNREHLVVSATYDLEYSDYEAMPERRRRRATAAASSRCRASSSSGRSGSRRSRSSRGRRPRSWSARPARRSTPTSTAG